MAGRPGLPDIAVEAQQQQQQKQTVGCGLGGLSYRGINYAKLC